MNHEPIIPECVGCRRVFQEVVGDKQLICGCHPFPHIRWFAGFPCPDATHIGNKTPNEDLEDEGRYDSRKKSK